MAFIYKCLIHSLINTQLNIYIFIGFLILQNTFNKTGTVQPYYFLLGVRVMALNATFNNISVISWRSALLVEETGVPRENQ